MIGKEKIGTDLDEVVFRFVEYWDLFLKMEGYEVRPERFDRGVLDEKSRRNLLVELSKYNLFKIIPYYPLAKEALSQLYQDFDLTIVTARDGYMKGKRDTLERLSKDYVIYDKIVFDSDKAKIVDREGLKWFIEDSPENALSIAEKTNCKVYLMDRPYNRHTYLPKLNEQIIRVHGWEDCLQKIYLNNAIPSSLEKGLECGLKSQKLSHNVSVDVSSIIS